MKSEYDFSKAKKNTYSDTISPELHGLIEYFFLRDAPTDRIKIDHYSWIKDSLYRYFEKDSITKQIMQIMDIVVKNEFLRWDDEFTKRNLIDGLSYLRYDKNIPSHDAWENSTDFENKAIEVLCTIIKNNDNSEITDIFHKVEQDLKNTTDKKETQIYERILYELSSCSLNEFNELKNEILTK